MPAAAGPEAEVLNNAATLIAASTVFAAWVAPAAAADRVYQFRNDTLERPFALLTPTEDFEYLFDLPEHPRGSLFLLYEADVAPADAQDWQDAYRAFANQVGQINKELIDLSIEAGHLMLRPPYLKTLTAPRRSDPKEGSDYFEAAYLMFFGLEE